MEPHNKDQAETTAQKGLMGILARFASVGIINTIIDFFVLNILILAFGIQTGTLYIVFRSVSFVFAATNSYLLNKYLTFKARNKATAREITIFFAVTLVSFFANVAVGYIFFTLFSKEFPDHKHLVANASTVAGVAVNAVLNFIGYKMFVFKKRDA